MSVIQQVLEEKDEAVIDKIAAMLKPIITEKKGSIYDFVGIIPDEEAAEMQQVIEETSGKINSDDWK